MKVNFTKIKTVCFIQSVLILVLLFTGCKSIDNFDAFSIFSDENSKEGKGLREYSDNLYQAPLVEYVLDETDPDSRALNNELKKTCEYAKIPYEAIEIRKWDSAYIIRPSTRVICLVGTQKLSNKSIDRVIEFVANGGTLFVPFSAIDTRVSYLFGFKPEADYNNDMKTKGYHFNTAFLPSLNGMDLHKNIQLNGFAKTNFSNSKDIKVLVTASSDHSFPAVIDNQIGAGHVILINGQNSFEKRDRGFCFAAILSGLEGIPYPIANTSTIFLDDFPCPLFNGKAEPIASEMNLGQADYVSKIWWPDMKRLAKKYNISYSAMLVFDYKNKVEPPFIFDQWDQNSVKYENKMVPLSEYLGHDAAKNGHELALHGYNHVEYLGNLWKNQDYVGTALNSAKKKWDLCNFGKLPVSYVPPSNYIDDRGIDKLKKEMPSLKYLCSSYNGETKEGENREFDFDPYNKGFFDYPRITYGFYLDEEKRYNQQSTYLYTGIWTHFVHPDDVYQIRTLKNKTQGDYELRNSLNLGWYKTNGQNRGLFSEFDKYLKGVTTNFPQIRFLNAGEAANIVLDWRASNFRHSSKKGIYTVEEIHSEQSMSDNQYWFLYVSSKNVQKMEAAFKNQVSRFSKTPLLEGFLYCLYTNKSKMSLPDLNYRTSQEELAMMETIRKVKNDYKEYQKKVFHFHNDDENWFDDSEIKFKRELDSLKQKMVTEVKIDSITWNRYTKYMLWDDKGAEVWGLFEDHCKKYPLPENILYSKELSKTNDYPNDVMREKWLYSQIEVMPTDDKTMLAYIDSYNTPENKDKIKIVFEHLLAVDHSFDTHLQYLQYLLSYEPKTALCDLNAIEPSEKYKILATDICWLYADDNQSRKAYDWSAFTSEIDFSTKMNWLIDLKSFDLLEKEYKKYIAENDDYKAKAVMAEYYHTVGRFEEAWVLASTLPDSPEKTNLKSMLNKDVKYVDAKLQETLINQHPEFFESAVKNEIIKTNRLESGNFWAYNTAMESNRQYLSAFKNVLSYNFYSNSRFLNSIAFTYSKMYSLKYNVIDPDNVTHNVYGLQYQLDSPKADEKWKYWSRFRAEYSDSNYYYHFGAGTNFSKNKRFTSAELKIFPMENGPSYSKNIYRSQLNLYNDTSLFKRLNTSISFEGNFYTKSKGNTAVKTSNSFEGTLTGKAIWDRGLAKKSKWLPFAEISYLKSHIGDATLNTSIGYPYWIIDERFYSGGGLGWKLTKTDFTTSLEAGWFYDTYSSDFKRFIGNMTYQIFDYTALTANFEMYLQSKFYSNVLQFGVKYNMKKKQKK